MTTTNDKSKHYSRPAFLLLAILFFLWGVANNMTGSLLQDFRYSLGLSDIQESVIKSAFYVAYLFAALPAVMYLYSRHSYKSCIMLGLMLYAFGALLFFPAASMESYIAYIVAIYVMATGCAVLETVANTYIIASAPSHDKGVVRLNLAQSFNPLGSVLGIVLCQYLIIDNISYDSNAVNNPEVIREELDSITMVYAGVGEILLVFLVLAVFVNIPYISNVTIGRRAGELRQSLGRLMRKGSFVRGALALFVYMGAQAGVWGYTIPAINEQGEGFDAQVLYLCSMSAFAVSRFLFTWLMGHFRYQKLLLMSSILALLLTLAVILCSGVWMVASLIGISCCMSLMFATIFGMSLEDTGRDVQTGGAILVMTIAGGALLLTLQGYLSRTLNAQMSYILPALCFLGVVTYSAFALLLSDKKSN